MKFFRKLGNRLKKTSQKPRGLSRKFFKNPVAFAVLFGAILISGSVIAYALINSSSNAQNKKASALEAIMNQDKYFGGLPFQNDEYILGNPNNRITVLVYSDFECPYCKMLQENTVQKLQSEYSTDASDYTKGSIGIVYRHFALSFHTKAPNESQAALCTRGLYGQYAYINFINHIYDITPANNGLDPAQLPVIAEYAVNETKEKGETLTKDFNLDEFNTCVSNQTYNAEFQADYNDAINAGLDGTPYSLILYRTDDGQQMIIQKISGAYDLSYFEAIINKLLALN